MIVHITMAKYKDSAAGRSKQENMERGKLMTEALKERIPSIKKIEVGINMPHTLPGPTAFDVVSTSEYDDIDALKATLAHPVHDDLVAFLKEVTEASHAVTYEVAR